MTPPRVRDTRTAWETRVAAPTTFRLTANRRMLRMHWYCIRLLGLSEVATKTANAAVRLQFRDNSFGPQRRATLLPFATCSPDATINGRLNDWEVADRSRIMSSEQANVRNVRPERRSLNKPCADSTEGCPTPCGIWPPCDGQFEFLWPAASSRLPDRKAAWSCFPCRRFPAIISFTLVFDIASPPEVCRPDVKKYFISKTPCGVCMYLPETARLTVVSCTPTTSATWTIVSGFRCAVPFSMKSRCRFTISLPMFRIVDCRWCKLLMRNFPARIFSRM